jgi:hypothetical protein
MPLANSTGGRDAGRQPGGIVDAKLDHPAPVEEASIAITLKLPPRTVGVLRAYAASNGLTIGEIVTRALGAFMSAL